MRHCFGLMLIGVALVLVMLGTSSCEGQKYKYEYNYELCKLDSTGAVTWHSLPPSNKYRIFTRLMDGRLLMMQDSLAIYDPETKGYERISIIDYPGNLDLSQDGTYCLYPKEGKIIRLHLSILSQGILMRPAEGSNYSYSRPTISRDGRYLCALTGLSTGSAANLSWMDLLSTEQYNFPYNYHSYFQQAWIENNGTGIYYISSGSDLKKISLQGTGDVTIRSGISWSYPSYDNKYLICKNSEYQPRLIYRDNQTLTWYDTDINGKTRVCRAANIVYYFKDSRLWKYDLESGQSTQLITGRIGNKQIYSIVEVAPSWDGSDYYMLFSTKRKIELKSKFPL